MDTIQGTVLRIKLRHLDDWNNRRREIASLYDKLLAGLPIDLPPPLTQGVQVYHVYVIATDERDRLQKYLATQGVPSIIHYPVPIHLQPAFAHLGYNEGAFPITEQLARRVLSLPIFPEMTEEQVEYVATAVRGFFERG
jgi:dTDP-4-amino-4,6-dideoxygalactose transaminase